MKHSVHHVRMVTSVRAATLSAYGWHHVSPLHVSVAYAGDVFDPENIDECSEHEVGTYECCETTQRPGGRNKKEQI